ncbi:MULTISPECIES: hypothetical protein [Flavobacterium]|uniref:Uncharacterized protein n=1 Tax=Flavobacterium columnare TaxID=996 RepID=A0AA94JQ41_9FLAO|nr:MULTISPECIES: hypothetical protein [Flavobacterium]MCH4829786.1 hypothetical protein [Flavobacterium columnare]QYS90720.1 hypothetical protein JJC04_12120 [Flavobacterium covae]
MENNIFKANPKLDCYYETSDGVPFYTDYAAKTHAQTLDDKTVTPVHRYAVKTVATEPVDAPVEEIPRDTEPTEPTDVPVESDERGGTDASEEETPQDTEPTEPTDVPVEETPQDTEPAQKEPKPKTKK